MRAFLVMVLVATPSLLLPHVSIDTAQMVALVALAGGALTLFEYGSAYPSLVEFRDAPPFNRLRFGSLFITVLLLSLILRGVSEPTTLTEFVTVIGDALGRAIDFPYSPVRLVVRALPDGTAPAQIMLVRTAAGLSYLISLLTLVAFLAFMQLRGWPSADRPFNVWVNMPTFYPTIGADVAARLTRDGRLNIILGFLLPFVMPAALKAATALFVPISLDSSQTLVWIMAAWAFLPASLFMRGIAMRRVADMIREKQRQAAHVQAQALGAGPRGWQPA